MPSANLDIVIKYDPEVLGQLLRITLILPQLKFLNNTCALADLELLTVDEKKIWVNFNEPLFYQGQAWIECLEEKVFLYDHLSDLLFSTFSSQLEISAQSTLYLSQNQWHLHHTARNWVYQSPKPPSDLTRPCPLTVRLGFFEATLPGPHAVEELFQQFSSLKNEDPIIHKYNSDAFDDFPLQSDSIPLTRARSEWQISWQEIRSRRHSSEAPNSGLDVLKLGCLLDVAFSASPPKAQRIRRGYPSAGGFYSECVLLEANRVEGIKPGTYLYHPREHALYLVSELTTSKQSLSILIASRIELLRRKYSKISTRLMYLNTGVMLHQLSLSCALMQIEGYPYGDQKQYPWNRTLTNIWPADWKISGRFIIN